MSDSDDSEDSEQRAITDKKVDAYFPIPIDSNQFPQITANGFKPITKAEELNLLNQGIMTYYRGHTTSKCCEACDETLRASDKYARSKEELRPVYVQKHKYIDKRKIDCALYKHESLMPDDVKTGRLRVVSTKYHRASDFRAVKAQRDINFFNRLYTTLKKLDLDLENHFNHRFVYELRTVILDDDFPLLMFHPPPGLTKGLSNLEKYTSNLISDIRNNMFSRSEFRSDENLYATHASLVLVMLEELFKRHNLFDYVFTFIESLDSTPFDLDFKKMVEQLSQLPVYKEPERKAAKVRFSHFDSPGGARNEEFIRKRKNMDTCPCEVKGKLLKYA